jgi:ribosomal protein S25
MLAFVNDASRKPIVDDLGQSDLTKEDFGRVDTLIQTNIFSGHQITTPSIFGIAEAGKLGSRTEMRDGYEIFKNTYVNAKQIELESTFNMLAGFAGYPEDLKIIPCEPIGLELSEQTLLQIAPKEWLLEKAGIDISKYEQPQVPVQQSFSEDFSCLYEFGEDKEKFMVWKQKSVFESANFADVTQLQGNVLDLISKDKRITPEVIADTLGEEIGVIKRVISNLTDKGFLDIKDVKIGEGIDSNIQIERTLTSPLADILEKIKPITRELLIRYSYEWKPQFAVSSENKSSTPLINNSRPFCVEMLKANKFYTRSEIEQLSARLGYSVWDRAGGWWTKKGTNIHSESCRHRWVSNIVTRK